MFMDKVSARQPLGHIKMRFIGDKIGFRDAVVGELFNRGDCGSGDGSRLGLLGAVGGDCKSCNRQRQDEYGDDWFCSAHAGMLADRKSTRLNSSHLVISY